MKYSPFLAFILLMVSGCDLRDDRAIPKSDIVRISNSYLETELKDNPKGYDVVIHDDKNTWIVSYHLPAGQTGGGPIVQIDKESGAVVGAFVGGQ